MSRLKWLLLLPLFALFSCVDENETLGIDLIDENDKLSVGLFTDVKMSSCFFKEDSLLTANYRYNVFGEYKDDKFGSVSSEIFTQLCLSSTAEDFTTFAIDSIYLTLAYSGGYSSDTALLSTRMKVSVYELDEALDSTKKYSFNDAAVKSLPIFSSEVDIDVNSDVVMGTDTLNPHLRLKITDNEFCQKIQSFKGDNDQFQELIKGIKIVAEKVTEKGFMAYVDMTSSITGLVLYYEKDNKKQTYKLNFPERGNRFMRYEYDFTGSEINGLERDTLGVSSEYIYLGNMGISMAKLDIDEQAFKNYWRDSINQGAEHNNVAINRAVIEIPIAEIGQSALPIQKILCYRKYVSNGDTIMVLIHDAQVSDTYYDGRYEHTTNSYRLNVTMHFENYLNGNIDDLDLYLVPDERRSTANRVVLNGTNNQTKPIKIRITYSKPK
ncbi:MAG: DUF4270 family protein [Bacteroidales bacterium]|nr:DUF4270 family protein [Bacteroidales bacterium]